MPNYFSNAEYLMHNRSFEAQLSDDESPNEVIGKFRNDAQSYLDGKLSTGRWKDAAGNEYSAPFETFSTMPVGAQNWIKQQAIRLCNALFIRDRAKNSPTSDIDDLLKVADSDLDLVDSMIYDMLRPEIEKRIGGIPSLTLIDSGAAETKIPKVIQCSHSLSDRRFRFANGCDPGYLP